MNGWRVAIKDERFPRNEATIVVYRPFSDGRTEVLLRSGERYVLEQGVEADIELGFSVPWDALETIRDAIDERVGWRPDSVLVAELRAALDHEKERVDRVLGRLLGEP